MTRETGRIRILDILTTGFIYFLAVAAILSLSFRFLREPELTSSSASIAAGLLLFIIPVILFGVAAVNAARIVQARRKRLPGSRLSFRLAISFTVVTVFSCAPQAILLLLTDYALVDTWYQADIKESIDSAGGISVMYYGEIRDRLAVTANREGRSAVVKFGMDAAAILDSLQDRYPGVSAVQIVRVKDSTLKSAGDPDAFLAAGFLLKAGTGAVQSDIMGNNAFIRTVERINAPPAGEMVLMASARLAREFLDGSARISKADDAVNRILMFRPTFKWIVAALYLAIALPLLSIASLLGISLSQALSDPIRRMEEAAANVAAGDLSTRVLVRSSDELGDLALYFNKMLSALEKSSETALQSEKISVWQDIAQKLAHELKNPLTPIKLSAERVLRRHKGEPARVAEILEPAMLAIIQEVDRLASMLGDFRNFARLPEPQFGWTDFRLLAEETIAPYSASHAGITFDISGIDPALSLRVDRNHIKQVLVNLVANAIDAMKGKGTIQMSTDLVKKGDSSYSRIRVRDTGPGIPVEVRNRVFTPYFTTKEKGSGLGLSIVEHIVIDHKGEIWFETETGVGTTFIIDLPGDSSEGT